jgi:hypothetical protein
VYSFQTRFLSSNFTRESVVPFSFCHIFDSSVLHKSGLMLSYFEHDDIKGRKWKTYLESFHKSTAKKNKFFHFMSHPHSIKVLLYFGYCIFFSPCNCWAGGIDSVLLNQERAAWDVWTKLVGLFSKWNGTNMMLV